MKKRILSLIIISLCLTANVSAQSTFNRKNFPAQVKVTATALNVRSGPGAWFTKVGTVYQNQIIDCVGKIGSWFVVHLENDTVGLISGSYSKAYYESTTTTPPTASTPSASAVTPSAEETEMLRLVNEARAEAGLSALTMNSDLLKVARLKSKDMVDLGYFSHTSPTYGTPFQMLSDFGISYKTAGENIAANSSVASAHTSLMNSSGHRANILNSNYTIVGIGVVDSAKYGKMITQIFVGR